MKKQNVKEFIEFSSDKLTKRVIYKEGNSTAFILNFQPGQSLPTHKHPGATLYLLVLQGEGVFTINGEEVPVVKDDILLCVDEEELAFTNNGTTNVSLYVVLNNLPSDAYAQNV